MRLVIGDGVSRCRDKWLQWSEERGIQRKEIGGEYMAAGWEKKKKKKSAVLSSAGEK